MVDDAHLLRLGDRNPLHVRSDDRDDQAKLCYEFCLEDQIPADYLLRKIDRLLDFGTLRSHLAPHYSQTARPSIDPELMIRILIVGYCFAIRPERRLCEEVDLNLAYRWFCRLGLVGGEGLAVDASLIAADANKQRSAASFELILPRLSGHR